MSRALPTWVRVLPILARQVGLLLVVIFTTVWSLRRFLSTDLGDRVAMMSALWPTLAVLPLVGLVVYLSRRDQHALELLYEEPVDTGARQEGERDDDQV